jgi:hypothetical protein
MMRYKPLMAAAFILILISSLFLLFRSKETTLSDIGNSVKTDTTLSTNASSLTTSKTPEHLIKWLNKLHLEKPTASYKAIFDIIYSKSNAQNIYDFDEAGFTSFIKDFKVLPFKDAYILAHIVGPYAVFNKADSLIAFYQNEAYEPSSSDHSYDSLYLKDWNNDGQVELLLEHSRNTVKIGYESNSNGVKVFDMTSINNQIIPVFDYNTSESMLKSSNQVTDIVERQIVFENANLFKMIERRRYEPITLPDEKDYNGNTALYQQAIKDQQDYLKTHSSDTTINQYYIKDPVTKKYIAKQ